MAERKYTTIKSRALRLTRLDECGGADFGSRGSLVHLGGFTKTTTKFDVQEGDKLQQRDDWGDFCVNEIDKPRLLGADVESEFCRVSPDTHEMMAGARVIPATADDEFAATGVSVGFALGEDTVSGDVLLECWTKVGGGACTADGVPLWVWTCWPWLTNCVPTDRELSRGTMTFGLNARAQGASASIAAEFPYTVAITPISEGESYIQRLTAVQPPAATDGAVTLVAP